MKFSTLLPLSLLLFPFFIQANAQIDCCGLAVGTVIRSPSVTNIVSRKQNFRPRTPPVVLPISPPSVSRPANVSSFSNQASRTNFPSVKQAFHPNKVSPRGFVTKARGRICGKTSPPPIESNNQISSDSSFQPTSNPLVVYYMDRPIKSIRVSSVPDIERWESALRKNMALNGRNKSKVDELLNRIRNHYGDQTIEAKDYSPNGEGYVPSEATRSLAESRIERTVKGMADFFEKSGNPEMNPFKSASGDSFLKGKLAFVNTELDKIGKPRVSLEELKQVISLQMSKPSPGPTIDRFEVAGKPVEKAPLQERVLDESKVKDLVKARYIAFAGWLAENDKQFPSLDREVDAKTMATFDLVNNDLRKIGKFESMTVFREKTIAYLEDIQDGQIRNPMREEPLLAGLRQTEREVDRLPKSRVLGPARLDPFAAEEPVHSHLPFYPARGLPGKAWEPTSPVRTGKLSTGNLGTGAKSSFATPSSSSLPGISWDSSGRMNQTGQSMRIIRSELNNLPGTPI